MVKNEIESKMSVRKIVKLNNIWITMQKISQMKMKMKRCEDETSNNTKINTSSSKYIYYYIYI